MPNMVPYTLTFEIVTIFFFLPGNFPFFSPIQEQVSFAYSSEEIYGLMGSWRPAGLPSLVSKSLEPLGTESLGMDIK